MGEKGRANENIIRNFLIKFLPKKYDVGSGILIDRKGKSSNQCDVVIYDKEYHPDFFGQRSSILFPVDVVYATIEVKTTLDQKEIKLAIGNIFSVKTLDIIPKNIPITGSSEQSPTHPLGMIFAYDSKKIKKIETIKTNFEKYLSRITRNQQPDLGIILQKGLLMYHKPKKSQLKFFRTYKNNENVNSTRTFLHFLTLLYDKLREKQIQKEPILSHYLEKEFFNDYEI